MERCHAQHGHDGKVCAGLRTKVRAPDECHAHTLMGAEGQSMCVYSWINGLASRDPERQPRFDKQSVYGSGGVPIFGNR